MYCFDCATNGDSVTAVATCTDCGAAVCLACASVGRRTVQHGTAFAPAKVTITETRKVACPSCAAALATHHAGRYRFTAPTRILETR
jgi:hypothetical protein